MAEFPWYQEGPADRFWPPGREPTRAKPIGDAASEPMAVYLGSQAMEVIQLSLEQNPERPVAGLLVGFPLSGPRRPFVLVTDVIPFPVSPEDEGEIRFTSKIFQDILPLWQERRDGASIVGWCHARPNRGVALSNFHRFNHHRHFPRPWQVALVIDTARQASLVYRWENGELVPCEGFYFWDMRAEPAATLFESPLLALGRRSGSQAGGSKPQSASRRRRILAWLLMLLLLGAIVYLLIPQAPGSFGWMRERMASNTARLEELRENLDTAQKEQERLLATSPSAAAPPRRGEGPPSSLLPQDAQGEESGLVGSAAPRPQPAAPAANETASRLALQASPLLDTAPEQHIASGSAAEAGRAAPSSDAPPDTAEAASEYVIQPGDTMWAISRTLLGDPRYYRELAERNQIEDPDRIYPGQRIVVPSE